MLLFRDHRGLEQTTTLDIALQSSIVSEQTEYTGCAKKVTPRKNYISAADIFTKCAIFDRGDSAALILLDLSAAFDAVDHEVLLQRLRLMFGIDDIAHRWFQSYLSGRHQHVRRGSTRSSIVQLVCGMLQGSVLGPVLFVLYTADLISLIESHGLTPHLYGGDTQIYGSCLLVVSNTLSSQISGCISDVAAWMKSNRLQLNSDKTEVLWCTTSR